MTFADEIDKVSSSRFYLVRMTVSRYISEDLVADGTSRYKIDNFPYKVADAWKTETSGGLVLTELTEVSDLDAVGTNNAWDQQDDGTFRIRIDPDTINTGENGSDIFYLRYYIYLSGSVYHTSFYSNPTTTSGAKQFWEPRIVSDINLSSDSNDSVFGNIKSKASSIKIANEDGWFNQFLSDLDSAHNQEIKCWIVANDTVSEFFTAKIKSLTIKNTVSVSLYESTTALDQQASFGLSQNNLFWSPDTDYGISISSITPEKQNIPIPMIIGGNSWHETQRDTIDDSVAGVGDSYAFSRGQKSVVLNPNYRNPSSTQNRNHALCKVLRELKNTGLPPGGLPISTTRTSSFGTRGFIKIAQVNNANWEIGDTFSWFPGGLEVQSYGVVLSNEPFTTGGLDYNLIVWCDDDQSAGGSGGTLNSNDVIESQKSIGVICRSDAWADTSFWDGATLGYRPLMQDFDYTVTANLLESDVTNRFGFQLPIRLYRITLTNGFETQSVTQMSRSFDPSRDFIEWRVGGVEDKIGHGDVAKDICRSAGLDIDASTFDSANSTLPNDLQFQIPLINERDLLSYRSYLSQITRSLGTYITTNSDGQVEYRLLQPAVGGTAIGDIDILRDRVIRRRIWSDIAARFYSRNPHIVDQSSRGDAEIEVVSDKFRMLHQSQNDVTFDHILVNGADTARVHKILRNRAEVFTIEVSHRFFELKIGDSITLNHYSTGNVDKNLFIVGISKNTEKVVITARDFGELD